MAQETGIVPQGPPEYWKYQTGSGIPGGSNPGQMSRITTGARGANSPFPANSIVYVPGVGPMRLSDFMPGGNPRGVDVPVTSREQMRSSAVNRMVNINGQSVPLSGYMPKQYDPKNVDPTGGGNVDAYGNPIVAWSGEAPGGWEDPLANILPEAQRGPEGGPQEFAPGPQAGPPATNEYMAPTGPTGENFATNENMVPTGPNQFLPSEAANIPTNENMFPAPEFYPSEGMNVPTYEDMQPVGPDEYRSDTGANVATNESMTPTGPNEYLPSEGVNLPTNEAMYPNDPQQYLDSTAGANIPTDENMTANLAPDTFQPSDESFYYPSGDGTYTQLDASGNPVPDVLPATSAEEPGLSNIPGITWNAEGTGPSDVGNGPLYAEPKKQTTFGQDLRADLSDLGTALGTETPANTALTSASDPGFGQFGLRPSSFGGGAFWSPPGGSIGGPLGSGSHGQLWNDYFGRMSKGRMRRGGDPTLGFGMLNTAPGAAIARFAAGRGTGVGGRGVGYGIRGGGPTRFASTYRNPAFYGTAPVAEGSSRKPGGGAGITSGGGPGGIA